MAAVANNEYCGVGIAYNASIGGMLKHFILKKIHNNDETHA